MIKLSALKFFTKKNIPQQLPAPVRFKTISNLKFIDKLPVKSSDGETVIIDMYKSLNKDLTEFFSTEVYSAGNSTMGRHTYEIVSGKFFGDEMDTWNKYQGRGIGELMRLASIIEMKENNLDKMCIFALPEAVQFHSKYRLKPAFSYCQDAKKAEVLLNGILKQEHCKGNFALTAVNMLVSMSKPGAQAKQSFFEDLDKFLLTYIKSNKLQWDKKKFNVDIPMSLTLAEIKRNASFYNNLLKKHKIDYKI